MERMKFDMSAAWREAMAMVSANREVLLIVAGIFFFVPSLIVGLLIGDMQQQMFADPEKVEEAVLALYAQWWWLFVLSSVAGMLGYLTLLALLRDTSRPTVAEALKIGLIGILPGIGAYIVLVLGLSLVGGLLVALASAVGNAAVGVLVVVILVVGLIYVLVKVSLSGPVIAIDKVFNPFKILARSWRLTKGNSVRLCLFYVLLFIAYLVIATVLAMVVGLVVLAAGPSSALMVNALLGGLINAVAYMVFVAILAAVHRQLSGPSATAVSETFE
jgi:hypothetical protein